MLWDFRMWNNVIHIDPRTFLSQDDLQRQLLYHTTKHYVCANPRSQNHPCH
jgi:hypothetical protein